MATLSQIEPHNSKFPLYNIFHKMCKATQSSNFTFISSSVEIKSG